MHQTHNKTICRQKELFEVAVVATTHVARMTDESKVGGQVIHVIYTVGVQRSTKSAACQMDPIQTKYIQPSGYS